MRVLHVLEAVGGGTMRHLVDLVSATPIDHHVACPARRSTDLSHPDPIGALRLVGATVHAVPMSRRVLDKSNVRAVRELSKLIDEVKPDVIHAHASVAGALARLAARKRVPVVWTPHAVQGSDWVLRVERRLRSRADVVVVLSPSEAASALQAGIARLDQIRTIPNGVAAPVGKSMPRAEIGVPEGVPIVGFIGRLCAQKAPLDFIATALRVLDDVPKAHIVMVGSGPMLEEVLEAAQAFPTGRFHHMVRDSAAEDLLPAFDVLVTTSAYEGGPYLPLQAMHAGVAVVATRCVGLRDYVIDEVSGRNAAVGDVEALARATSQLLINHADREELVHRARLHVQLHHDLGLMARRYEDLYLELTPEASVVDFPRAFGPRKEGDRAIAR